MDTDNKQTKRPLKDALLERIDSEKVCPHSPLFFRGREFLVWFLWLLSVAVGALAVAVSLYVLWHHQYALYEATHMNFFTFLVDALPYLWIIIFGLMAFAAIYNIRHTRRGYRYSVPVIILSSAFLSFAGGSLLQFFGLGHEIDEMLGRHMAVYVSQGKYEQQLWQAPVDGRLVGKQALATLAPDTIIVFADVSGNRWRMDVSELTERDRSLLASEGKVRLLGKLVDPELRLFHACGVAPWMIDKPATAKELSHEREVFITQVAEHARKAKDMLYLESAGGIASTSLPQASVCATIATVRRMPGGMAKAAQ